MTDNNRNEQVPHQMIDKVLDFIYRLIQIVCALLMLTMVLVISYTVFCRFVLNNTPTWGEQLGIFCMVWIALLGSSLAVRDGRHIRMSVVEYIFSAETAKRLHQFMHVFILLVGMVFFISGIQLMDLTAMSIMGTLRISSAWLALSVPVSGIALISMLVARFRRGQW